jgi:DNA-binding LacI/PurR family transcriptional regulator
MAAMFELTKERIINYIAGNKIRPGERLPTEKQMAAICGVSMITARRALSELEAGNIVERVHGCGTFVKIDIQASPRRGRLLFVSIGNTSEGPHSRIFDTVEREASKRGCAAEFLKVGEIPETIMIERLKDCKGIFLYGWVNQAWVDCVSGLGIPSAAVSTDDFGGRIRTVCHDYAGTTRALLQRLTEMGAENIGILTAENSRYEQDRIRLDAYRDFLSARRLPVRRENWMRESAPPNLYYQAAGDFLTRRSRPLDGLIITGTDIYINLLNFLLEHPEVRQPLTGVFLQTVTYQLEHAALGRTVCSVPEKEIGAAAVDFLFGAADGRLLIKSRLTSGGARGAAI